jgi:hypothetical protein
VLRIGDIHPGSQTQWQKDSGFRIRIKEFMHFKPKNLLLSSRKGDPAEFGPDLFPIPDLGVKKPPDPRIRKNVRTCTVLGVSLVSNRVQIGSTIRNRVHHYPINL